MKIAEAGWDLDVVDCDDAVVSPEDLLKLLNPKDKEEGSNEWLDVAIDVSVNRVRGMNMIFAPGK